MAKKNQSDDAAAVQDPFGTVDPEAQKEAREARDERLEGADLSPADRGDPMLGWTAQMGGAPDPGLRAAYIDDPVVFTAEQLPPPEDARRSGHAPVEIPESQLHPDVRDDYVERVRSNRPPLVSSGVRAVDIEHVKERAEARGVDVEQVRGLPNVEDDARTSREYKAKK